MTGALACETVSVDRGGRRILDGVSCEVSPGSLTAVVGPNGSGKSTLLRVLAGLWSPATGRVVLEGRPVQDYTRDDLARRVSFLPQDTTCDFAFTVAEFVAMGRFPHRSRFGGATAVDRRAVEQALSTCQLDPLRARTVDRLSGGERQRAAIARCLATEAPILLLDEPTAHLDLEHDLSLLELCRALATEGRTVVFATHDLASVGRGADWMVVLQRGHVAAAGAPDCVLTRDLCRSVFAVDAEVVRTQAGAQALVFSALGARA